jgi:ribulose-phosphate 3-epimerase
MAVICPTITAAEPHEYRAQMERIAPFAERVHIDLADGVFTPNKLIDLLHVWWPVGVTADIHLMYKAVKPFIPELIKLKPHLVVVHAESAGNFYEVTRPLKAAGIRVGVALLAESKVSSIAKALPDMDHVLIFSGDLGHFGGHADTELLHKVHEIRQHNPKIEIGWDGGINEHNAKRLVDGGVTVLNTGGFIQRAEDPARAYHELVDLITNK